VRQRTDVIGAEVLHHGPWNAQVRGMSRTHLVSQHGQELEKKALCTRRQHSFYFRGGISTGDLTQCLKLARQALYHLNYTPVLLPFQFVFQIGSYAFVRVGLGL
jgi:hypothetical protein